jgi:hypothetical protein
VKYLKKYNLFESDIYSFGRQIEDEVEDILLSFSDAGFEVEAGVYWAFDVEVPKVAITIKAKKRGNFLTREDQIEINSDMIEDLNRLFGYLDNIGFKYIEKFIDLFAQSSIWVDRYEVSEIGDDFIGLSINEDPNRHPFILSDKITLKSGDKIAIMIINAYQKN